VQKSEIKEIKVKREKRIKIGKERSTKIEREYKIGVNGAG
jgi:hypothetical protein